MHNFFTEEGVGIFCLTDAGGGAAEKAGAAAAGAVHSAGAATRRGAPDGVLQPGHDGAARPPRDLAARQLEPLDPPSVLRAPAYATCAARGHRLPHKHQHSGKG